MGQWTRTDRPEISCDRLGYPEQVGDEEWVKHAPFWECVNGEWRRLPDPDEIAALHDVLHGYSEWLDGQSLLAGPGRMGGDERTHDDLVREYLAKAGGHIRQKCTITKKS